jgi:RNA polymerase sigma-70 factor (ECF subfamily)
LIRQDGPDRFEKLILPHLDAAYNLARWLTGSASEAEDVVQDACLRALRFFGGFRGGDGRSWFLTIVRNSAYSWIRRHRGAELLTEFDEEVHTIPTAGGIESLLGTRDAAERLGRALAELPVEYREVIVLRELEGLSYKEIADVAALPIGTVMSRLARARRRLHHELLRSSEEGTP